MGQRKITIFLTKKMNARIWTDVAHLDSGTGAMGFSTGARAPEPRMQPALETKATPGPGPLLAAARCGGPGPAPSTHSFRIWCQGSNKDLGKKEAKENCGEVGKAQGRQGDLATMHLRTWNLRGVPGPPRMDVPLPQAGAKSGLQMLDPRMAQPVGSVLPRLLEQIIWKAQRGAVSHPQSHSTCVTVLNKNPDTPRVPVTPSKALLVPADLLLTPLPGLCILVSPEESGQAGQELLLPASTAKKILDSALPALPDTSPHFSLSPRNTHTCTHTTARFLHCSPFLHQLHQFPGPQGWKEPPRSSGSPLLTQNCHSDVFHKIPAKTSPPSSCTPPRTGSLLPPKTGFSLDCSDFNISSIHGRGSCFSVVLSMASHLLSFPKR